MIREKELRLALVCYGGISLAVYMHGITLEIWRLAKASQAFRDHRPAATGSQGVYRALLHEIEATADIRLRVLVDIIAGASAGGMNGVFLAQAITTGQSIEPLTDLWLDHADVEALLDEERRPKSRLTKVWALPIAWMAASRASNIEETVEAGAREEVRAKLETFVRSRWFEPPFGGKRLLNLTLDAFEEMAKMPSGKRLLPDGQPLDLFVTVTDFRGHPERLRLNSPPEVIENEHRLVLGFTDHGHDASSLAALPELAFAARATSSFPGAFPPFTVRELDSVVAARKMEWPTRNAFLQRVLPRQYASGMAETAPLIDGSVLANAPFRPAIDALRERPARRQVDRRFVFIDPTPNVRFDLYGVPTDEPGFIQTIIGSLSELPREQPIRDNLEALEARSERIERTRTIVGQIRGEVEAQVEALFGYTLFLDYPTPKRLHGWRKRAQVNAAAKAGYGHIAYGLLKVDGMIDRIARHFLQIAGQTGPERANEIKDAVIAVVRGRGYDDFTPSHSAGAAPATLDFLRTHDLGFRIRRLRLLARRVTELDEGAAQAELTQMREAVYESLAPYLECQRSDPFAELREPLRELPRGGDIGPMLDRLGALMDLQRLDAEADERLSNAFAAMTRERRRPILLALLGFPFFDIATLPLLQGEGLDEFDPIRVDRISPDDACGIRDGGARATLKGVQFNSFGAFFSRAYRENDYLWGRLHGADRLIDIVLSTLDPARSIDAARVAAIKRAAFLAILDEEESRLKSIPNLFRELRDEIG